MTRVVGALIAAAAILAAACAPSAPPPSTSAGPSGDVLPPTPGLARVLRDAIEPAAIMDDLRRLEAITTDAGGSRFAGGEGYGQAAAFVADELEAAGLHVTLDEVEVPVFRQTGPGTLEIQAKDADVFEPLTDFKPLLLSPAGDVTAAIVSLGFDPTAGPESSAGRGCDPADWTSFPSGAIALVQPGPCRARQVVENAQQAGAAAVVRSYPAWTAGHVLRPTLLDPGGLTIPVTGTTNDVGLALNEAATAGLSVRVAVETETTMGTAVNVLAETFGGDPGNVVMLGGHLDSVIDGPGMNDNGSGAMTLVEIARGLGTLPATGSGPEWQVRLAFWTGEELGLFGSLGWFGAQDPDDLAAIAAYLNFDMLGSPNGVREIYHWSADGVPGSARVEALFGQAFDLDDRTWELVQVGSSDDLPFAQAGIPTSGLFSGHNTLKTPEQAGLFGGQAGEPLDPCYHLACDTLDNVDPVLLGQMARAAAWVTGYLASGQVALP